VVNAKSRLDHHRYSFATFHYEHGRYDIRGGVRGPYLKVTYKSDSCLQSSIMAVQFGRGVVIGADGRTTTGSYVVHGLFVHHSQDPYLHRKTVLQIN